MLWYDLFTGGLLAFYYVKHNTERIRLTLINRFHIAKHIRQINVECFSLLSQVSIPSNILSNNSHHVHRAFFTARCDGEVSDVNFNLYDRKPFDTQAVAEMQTVLGCDHDKAIL